MTQALLSLDEVTRRASLDYEAGLNAFDEVKMAEHRSDCGRWLHAIRSHPSIDSRMDWSQWIKENTTIPRMEAKACLSAYNSLMGTTPATARNKARRLLYLMEEGGIAGGRTPEGHPLGELLEDIRQEAKERYETQTE
jgi:hypothetical protein